MYTFTKKNRVKFRRCQIVFIIIICTLVLLNLLHQKCNTAMSKVLTLLTTDPNGSSTYTCCTQSKNSSRPGKNIYFLKTHKTGSTTVQSILLRFAITNTIDTMCTIHESYDEPFSEFSIYNHTKTPNNKYHIFADHIRYHSGLKSYQYPDTPMVTILRHPATLFQSSYEFFQMNTKTGMSFEQFLKSPVKPKIIDKFNTYMHYIGYNQMCSDLGFNLTQTTNSTAVDEFVVKIDREFDLVMIMEHMKESLVLLANLMGWSLEDMAHVKMNAQPRNSNSYQMTEEDIRTLMNLNEVDTRLYDHILKKFRKCLRQYGEDEMTDRINRLRIINERFREKCVAREVADTIYYNPFVKVLGHVPKNESDLECVYSLIMKPPLSKVVCDLQAERLRLQ